MSSSYPYNRQIPSQQQQQQPVQILSNSTAGRIEFDLGDDFRTIKNPIVQRAVQQVYVNLCEELRPTRVGMSEIIRWKITVQQGANDLLEHDILLEVWGFDPAPISARDILEPLFSKHTAITGVWVDLQKDGSGKLLVKFQSDPQKTTTTTMAESGGISDTADLQRTLLEEKYLEQAKKDTKLEIQGMQTTNAFGPERKDIVHRISAVLMRQFHQVKLVQAKVIADRVNKNHFRLCYKNLISGVNMNFNEMVSTFLWNMSDEIQDFELNFEDGSLTFRVLHAIRSGTSTGSSNSRKRSLEELEPSDEGPLKITKR